MANWVLQKEEANIELMAQTLNITEAMAQVMVNRNVRTRNTALRFLTPELAFLHDPFLLVGMTEAIKIVVNCVSKGEKIVIYGDYDVDGVMSTTILYKTLESYGADVSFYIPQREAEGYGLNISAIQMLFDNGMTCLITCDNGISALAEVEFAKELGMIVIIIDHHQPNFTESETNGITLTEDVLPVADIIINPKMERCEYPFKSLCAAALCFKFSQAFHTLLEIDFELEQQLLALAMFATFADIVELQGENRIIAKHGLKILNENKQINLGLYELIKARGFEEKEITSHTMGFVLGPCINAAGRLESATIAVAMLVAKDENMARTLASQLAMLNDERKELTQNAFIDTLEIVNNSEIKDDKVLVVYSENIHESIAGIVAGRLKEHFYKPVIVLTKSLDFAKGSARSIENYNIFLEMYANKHLFLRFGGHKMAAGVSIVEENIPILRQNLNENCKLTEEDFVEIIKIDKELELPEITFRLAEEMAALAPFGHGNKEPYFATYNLNLDALKFIKEKNTIIFTFIDNKTNRRTKGVCFGKIEQFETNINALYDEIEASKIYSGVLRNVKFFMDVVYVLDINEYNGNISVQMMIKDFKIHL